jgi:hypothetical protein
MAKPEDDGLNTSLEETRKPNPQGDRIELFTLALVLGLGVGAVALAVLTRRHLFARQIAPAESPIQVI